MDAQPDFKLNSYFKDNFTGHDCGKEYVNFGLKGDKFAKFMVELLAEFCVNANADSKVKLYKDILDYEMLRPIYSELFSSVWKDDGHILSAQESVTNLNDKLFKIETNEICMLLNKKYRNKYHPVDNDDLVNKVAKTLNKLVCLNATYDYLNAKIQTIDVAKNPRGHVFVTIGQSIYKFKIDFSKFMNAETIQHNPTQNNFTGRDCNCFMVLDQYNFNRRFNPAKKAVNAKTLRYISLGHKDHPYKKIIKEEVEKYWNPQSTKKFFHTSFTCRDVYLIFLLLTGASKKVILKNYSEDEVAEIVGKDINVVDQEICKVAYDELDTFTKKFHEETKKKLDKIEYEFKRKLVDVKKARIEELVTKLSTLNDEYMDKLKELTPDIDGFSYPNKFMSVYGTWLKQLKTIDLDYDLTYPY